MWGRPAIAMIIKKSRIVELLRQRDQDARADWVDRVLPNEVDTVENASLLTMLHIDASELGEDGRRA